MLMKGGVERSADPNIERMLNIFYLHLSAPEEKAVSRIWASKTRRNLQTFGWCLQFKQSCPWASLSYFCTRKTSREINAIGWVVLRKNVSEKLSIINLLWRRRNPCNLNSLILPPNNHNLFCEIGLKSTSPECKSIVHGKGVCEERDGGGGAAAGPLHGLYMSRMICKWYDNMWNT